MVQPYGEKQALAIKAGAFLFEDGLSMNLCKIILTPLFTRINRVNLLNA
jgi:hypothetical protein